MQFSKKILDLTAEAEEKLAPLYREIDAVSFRNTEKIMNAFRQHRVSDSMFGTSSGYGNNDRGREVLDEIWAEVMGAEAAFVRVGIVSGTHALAIGLYGLLRPGDILYTIAGKPYDTLEEVIGLCGKPGNGSLKDFGVDYLQTDLNADGSFRVAEIAENLRKYPNIKVVFIQRSKGYLNRKTLSVAEIGEAIQAVRAVRKDVYVVVDNCYGEFVEDRGYGHRVADQEPGRRHGRDRRLHRRYQARSRTGKLPADLGRHRHRAGRNAGAE